VVALATERIEELSARKSAVTDRISSLKAERPAGHDPEEVAAMLDAIPDLSETLASASPQQLVEIFKAFKAISHLGIDRALDNVHYDLDFPWFGSPGGQLGGTIPRRYSKSTLPGR
jgi:hypothetical protein